MRRVALEAKIIVYYDGACPRCLREMAVYRWLDRRDRVIWFNVVGNESELVEQGIDPEAAIKKLHIRLANGEIVKDVEAFAVLWNLIPVLRPLAWIADSGSIRTYLRKWYGRLTMRRLQRQGRLCDDRCITKKS